MFARQNLMRVGVLGRTTNLRPRCRTGRIESSRKTHEGRVELPDEKKRSDERSRVVSAWAEGSVVRLPRRHRAIAGKEISPTIDRITTQPLE
jgi:hypothetical protein